MTPYLTESKTHFENKNRKINLIFSERDLNNF